MEALQGYLEDYGKTQANTEGITRKGMWKTGKKSKREIH